MVRFGGEGGGQCGDAAENLPGNTRREEFYGIFPRHRFRRALFSARFHWFVLCKWLDRAEWWRRKTLIEVSQARNQK